MTTAKHPKKAPNVFARFFGAIGHGIASFFRAIGNFLWSIVIFIWELIWTIVTFIYDLIISIIQATIKYILMVWGFILATILVGALVLWLVTLSFRNVDDTHIGEKMAEKLDPAITSISEQINSSVLEAAEENLLEKKEQQLMQELKRLQNMRIDELESELDEMREE